MGALVGRDLPKRVANARQHGLTSHGRKNQSKWLRLAQVSPDSTNTVQPNGLSSGSISDLRVAPFIATSWSQTTTDNFTNSPAVYNFFTPPHEAGNSLNAPSGCVATALAQVMYYFKWPATGVGTASYLISYNGSPMQWPWPLRGGDGYGGPYDWANMPLAPAISSPTLPQRMAIGALTYDAGVAVHMQYTDSSSGAYMTDAQTALVTTFKYSNAIETEASTINVGFDLVDMINPNLDARLPVVFGINNSVGGHCIICDGYGYSTQTLYHHLNMGWGGLDNAWYHFPIIDLTNSTSFNNFTACIYNIFTNGSGEIISGRVVDTNGLPLAGASLTATNSQGTVITATSDKNGIYALVGVPSATACTVVADRSGYFPISSNLLAGTSSSFGTNCGNIWGVNFTLVPAQGPPVFVLPPADQFVTTGSNATFNAYATGQLPLSYHWQYQPVGGLSWIDIGSPLPSLTISPADLSMSGNLFRCIATNTLGSATSAPPATLWVSGAIPRFVIQPQNQIVLDGSNAVFSAFASGTAPVSYQWQYQPSGNLTWLNVTDDGTNSGSQNTVLTISPVNLAMNGKPFHCVAANPWGTGTSAPVTLSVSVDNSASISLATLAGLAGTNGAVDGVYTNALFNNPCGIAVDAHTNIYVADMYNHIIRQLTPGATGWSVKTIAGLAGSYGSANGTNSNARFNGPYGIAVDGSGNVFVADTSNHTIRQLTPAGTNWVVSTIAGLAGTSGTNDGANARFRFPTGIALDGANNLFVADQGNHSIRKLTSNGFTWTASTIAGGSSGSNDGTNRQAQFGQAYALAVNFGGTVFVADRLYNTIRQLTPSGSDWIVTTIAGQSGLAGGSADGLGSSARFKFPSGIAAGIDGNLYVADYGNNTIRRLAVAGANWTVFTVAGLTGNPGSVDGTGSSMRLNGPFGIAVDSHTNVYVSDSLNNTIRGPGLPVTPIPSIVNLSKPGTQNAFNVTWNAVAGHSYQVQFITNLSQAAWHTLSTVTASNWTGVISIPVGSEPSRFYRVVPAP